MLTNIFTTLKTAYEYKLEQEEKFSKMLKDELIEAIENISKQQLEEFGAFTLERRQLEKDHKHYFERMEMSQKSYFLHGRERDAVALEKESLLLHKKQSEQRVKKVTEKFFLDVIRE